jgi:hypothetical protein
MSGTIDIVQLLQPLSFENRESSKLPYSIVPENCDHKIRLVPENYCYRMLDLVPETRLTRSSFQKNSRRQGGRAVQEAHEGPPDGVLHLLPVRKSGQ